VKVPSEPQLPLFNDREGLVLFSIEKWLNSHSARSALPIEQFEGLYCEGRIQVLAPAFSTYLTSIKKCINSEFATATKSQGYGRSTVDQSYVEIEKFFASLARLSSPSS
jgi:hypothetical protein